MQTSKRIAMVAVFLIAVIAINALLTFLLVPYRGSTEVMWQHYHEKAKNEIDTVFVGSSQCHNGIDPSIIDEKTGLHSYNMGTDSQSYYDALLAAKKAIREHEITHVYLTMEYEYLFDENINDKAEANFSRQLRDQEPFGAALKEDLQFAAQFHDTAISINYFFPWTSNHVYVTPGTILQNVRNKTGHENAGSGSARLPNGFTPSEGSLDYNTLGTVVQEETLAGEISQEVLNNLSELSTLCKENGVQLTAITVPIPKSVVLQYGNAYFQLVERLKAFSDEHGFRFYDFNLLKPDHYEFDRDCFRDYMHLNSAGARAYSEVLANLINQLAEGSSVAEWFYTSREDYIGSITEIDSVSASAALVPGDGITISASAYCSPELDVEYQFVQLNSDGSETVLQDYGNSETCSFTPEKNGTYTVRVYAKERGSEAAYDRYYDCETMYWVR